MLHRAVSRAVMIPDTIDSIILLVTQIRVLYFAIRVHFEADDGISLAVADALPPIELESLLKTLHSWENDHESGLREYQQRDCQSKTEPLFADSADGFLGSVDCWQKYRLWMFEANRALTICRNRVSVDAPYFPPKRYDWLS